MKIVMFHRLLQRHCRKPVLELLVADCKEIAVAGPGSIIRCEEVRVKGKEEQLKVLLSMLARVEK